MLGLDVLPYFWRDPQVLEPRRCSCAMLFPRIILFVIEFGRQPRMQTNHVERDVLFQKTSLGSKSKENANLRRSYMTHPRILRLVLDHHRRLGVCTPTRICSFFLSKGFSSPLSGPTWAMRVRILGTCIDRALVPVLFVRFQSRSWGSGADRSAGRIRGSTQGMGDYEVPAS